MSFAVLSDQWRSPLTLQHAVATVSPEEPNANASHEGLAQIAPAPVRQITAQSYGMEQLLDNSGTITSAGGWGIIAAVPIQNSGTIEGLFGAIQSSGGVLVNSGTINGEVRFFGGNDLYDGISGKGCADRQWPRQSSVGARRE